MKHSWLRLFSSVYILLVSALLIVISAYAWMTISSSPLTSGGYFSVAGRELMNIPDVEYEVYDPNAPIPTPEEFEEVIEKDEETGAFVIKTPSDLIAFASYINKGGENGTSVKGSVSAIIVNHLDMTGAPLEQIYVDGYNGTGKISITSRVPVTEGAENTEDVLDYIMITGLEKPLFSGGFAGESAIHMKDIAIVSSDIVSENEQGSGAFIECVDSMQEITLENCRLLNSTLQGSRVGGLIGWTSGYSNENDGAVKTFVTLKNCVVEGCEITGAGTTGGLIGQAGASAYTYQLLEGCSVSNTTLRSINESNKGVGAFLGTANVGEVTLASCTFGQVRLIGEGATSNAAVGRIALGATGKLAVAGRTGAEIYGGFPQYALDYVNEETQRWMLYTDITVSEEIRFHENATTVKISAADDRAVMTLNSAVVGYCQAGTNNGSSGFNFGPEGQYCNVSSMKEGSTIEFMGIQFDNEKDFSKSTNNADRHPMYTYAFAQNVKYTDCVFNGGVLAYYNTSFERCTFNEDRDGFYALFCDNEYGQVTTTPTYAVKDCKFTAASTAYGCLKVADDENKGATLLIEGSTFTNASPKPAVYINGLTQVTETNNTFDSANGPILAKATGCTLNGEACMTVDEFKAGSPAQESDDKTPVETTTAEETTAETTTEATTTETTTAGETTTETTTAGETTTETTTVEETTTETTTVEETTTETTTVEATTTETTTVEATTTETTTAEETTVETTTEATTVETTTEATTAETTTEEQPAETTSIS